MSEYLDKTEFEIATQLENWMKEDDSKCSFCASCNFQIIDVIVEDANQHHKIHDWEYIDLRSQIKHEELWDFSLVKKNHELKISEGGKVIQELNFLIGCLSVARQALEDIDEDDFTECDRGNFYVCFTGLNKENPDDRFPIVEGYKIRLEKFLHFGISKTEIDTILYTRLMNVINDRKKFLYDN